MQTAVNIQHRAGHVTGQIRRQEKAAFRHLFRLAKTPHRHLCRDIGFYVLSHSALCEIVIDDPRRNRVDPDTFGRQFPRKGLAKAENSPLGGCVVGTTEEPAADLSGDG